MEYCTMFRCLASEHSEQFYADYDYNKTMNILYSICKFVNDLKIVIIETIYNIGICMLCFTRRQRKQKLKIEFVSKIRALER